MRHFALDVAVAIQTAESHTAILFFSHRPAQEWRNKRYVLKDYAKSRQAAHVLYRHAQQAAESSGLPVLRMTGERQRGDSFGERLANAFADAFAQGYTHVIAVGSDCPRLHEVDWEGVTHRLEGGKPVLGPTPGRDGAYLIGLSQGQFDRQAFAALPWQSPALLGALEAHLDASCETAPMRLVPRDDVNGHHELVALVREDASPRYLLAQLRSIFGRAVCAIYADTPIFSTSVFCYRLRGPPVRG